MVKETNSEICEDIYSPLRKFHKPNENKMGINYKCGCRCSAGHWFLCKKHETDIIFDIEIDNFGTKENRDKNGRKKTKLYNEKDRYKMP